MQRFKNLKIPKLTRKFLFITGGVCLILVTGISLYALNPRDAPVAEQKTVPTTSKDNKQAAKPVEQKPAEVPPQSTTPTPPAANTPAPRASTPPPTPQPRRPFSIGYVSLIQPQSNCSGGVDVITIQDASMTFPPNTDGGAVNYSFTVTGAVNPGGGSFTVPANVTSGTINQFRQSAAPIFYLQVPVPHQQIGIQLVVNGQAPMSASRHLPPCYQ